MSRWSRIRDSARMSHDWPRRVFQAARHGDSAESLFQDVPGHRDIMKKVDKASDPNDYDRNFQATRFAVGAANLAGGLYNLSGGGGDPGGGDASGYPGDTSGPDFTGPSGDPGGINSGFPDPGSSASGFPGDTSGPDFSGPSGSDFPDYTPAFDSSPYPPEAASPDWDNVPYEGDVGGREPGGTNFDPETGTGRGGGRSWGDIALKAAPLALSVAGQVANYRRSRDAAARMGQLGQPPNFAGIQSWQDSAIAASRQYFANSGLSNSTSAMQSENQIRQRAEEMRVNATLQQLNINDRYRAAAINMELRSDQQAIQQGAQFLSTYAQWYSWSDSMGY